MAVAHDAVSESHTGTSGVSGVASFNWNHVPTGTPRSALVFTLAIGANPVTAVTYGGTSMNAVPYTAYDSDTEPGFVQAWFLDNVASGTQNIVVTRTNNAVVTYACCMTQTAAKTCQVYTAGVKTRSGSGSEQTAASSSNTGVATSFQTMALDDGSPGTNSIRYMAVHHGGSSVIAAGTNTTTNGTAASIDFGLYVFFTLRETTPSQGSKTIGLTSAVSDDLAVIGLAVREDPNARTANVVNTGGGVVVEVGSKGATRANPATGGGILTASAAGAHNKAVVATGGGIAVPAIKGGRASSATATGGGAAVVAPVAGRQSAPATTGGGIVTIDYVVVSIDNRDASVVATGGGVAAVTTTTARPVSATATGAGATAVTRAADHRLSATAAGGGVATPASRKGALRDVTAAGGGVAELAPTSDRPKVVTATGGGVVAVSPRAGRSVNATATAGGTAAPTAATQRRQSPAATGAGIATIDAVAQVSSVNHDASVTATGGGIASPSIRSARLVAALLSGGGVLVTSQTTDRRGSVGATGAGAATVVGVAASVGHPVASVTATGGGVLTLDYQITVARRRRRAVGGGAQAIALAIEAEDEEIILALFA